MTEKDEAESSRHGRVLTRFYAEIKDLGVREVARMSGVDRTTVSDVKKEGEAGQFVTQRQPGTLDLMEDFVSDRQLGRIRELKTMTEKAHAWDQLAEAVRLLISSCRQPPTGDGSGHRPEDVETEKVPGTTDRPANDQ